MDRRRSYFSSGICTGFLLLLIAGADCWPWGSDPLCPPGPEPKCPINPVTDEANYFPHPTDCHYYIQCDGSRKPLCRPCSPATYFSPKIINCVWPMDAACEHNDTTRPENLQTPICGPNRCAPPGMKKRDYSDCTHYFICINETFEHRAECPKGQHFDAKINDCVDQCTAGCKDPCDIPGCDCPRVTYCTNIKVPGYCQWYQNNCTDTPIKCPGELNFNPATGNCEDPCKVYIPDCDCPITTGCSDTTPRIVRCANCAFCEVCRDGQTVEEICPTNLSNQCPTNKCCVLTRHETDCQLYYNDCSQSWSRCPGNLHFNELTQSCDHPCSAGCKDARDIAECCTTEGEVFEDPCSCNMYYSCRNGIKELAKCDDGLQYNSALRCCDKSCSCDCPKLLARNPECCASTGGKPEPQCPHTPYPIFLPHPNNGQYFYKCLNGVRSCSRCPSQRRWNIDTDTCDE